MIKILCPFNTWPGPRLSDRAFEDRRIRQNMWDFPVGRLKREKLGIRFKRKRKARIGCLEQREVRDIYYIEMGIFRE